ncbi:MAG TPA: methylated-DNA--[protein]-cysteine S-methyltransferase [Burkholderiaceae bacterium]|nr:methylated-DNA--[protein]-cysteine S-methyltransferase [Burkholderiaceae bacterium]
MPTTSFSLFETVLGECAIAGDERGVIGVQLPESSAAETRARIGRDFPGAEEAPAPEAVRAVIARIAALLRGERDAQGRLDDLCSVELDMTTVSPFQRRVYEATRAIPPGRTITYGELAAQIGEPGAARAVGHALGLNPFAPVVPCHRVLAAGGKSGGFSAEGGVATKLRMLQVEGARFGDSPGLFDAGSE